MFPHGYWGGGFYGPPYWAPATTEAAPPAPKRGSAPAVGKKRPHRWLVAELERSVLEADRQAASRMVEMAFKLQQVQREEYRRQLEQQQLQQARTAITAVFVAEL